MSANHTTEYQREWREAHPGRHAQYNRKYRQTRSTEKRERAHKRTGDLLRERKRKRKADAMDERGNKCTDCGLVDHLVMEWDHVKGPKLCVPCKASGDIKYKAELIKCELVCANCHRRRTHKRRVDGLILSEDGWIEGGKKIPDY